MDVRLCLTKPRTIHDLLARSATRAAARVDLLRVRAGGTSGGIRRFGGIDALGVSTTACTIPHKSAAAESLSYPLELAREANSYGRGAYSRDTPWMFRAQSACSPTLQSSCQDRDGYSC
jgi:hypothetical protein